MTKHQLAKNKLNQKWLEDNDIRAFQSRTQAPDLNKLEYLWEDFKKAAINANPQNKNEIIEALFRAWGNTSQLRIQTNL